MGPPVATRYYPVIREFCERLLAAGKLKKVVLAACMRTLLLTQNAICRNNEYWRGIGSEAEQTSAA